jgi:hypothetical protein
MLHRQQGRDHVATLWDHEFRVPVTLRCARNIQAVYIARSREVAAVMVLASTEGQTRVLQMLTNVGVPCAKRRVSQRIFGSGETAVPPVAIIEYNTG